MRACCSEAVGHAVLRGCWGLTSARAYILLNGRGYDARRGALRPSLLEAAYSRQPTRGSGTAQPGSAGLIWRRPLALPPPLPRLVAPLAPLPPLLRRLTFGSSVSAQRSPPAAGANCEPRRRRMRAGAGRPRRLW
eukprot:SAG11_NODE_1759_length_4305_cov_3.542558_5_plen_135_part_00